MVKVMATASRIKMASRIFPSVFTPHPQAKDLRNASSIPYKYFEMEKRGIYIQNPSRALRIRICAFEMALRPKSLTAKDAKISAKTAKESKQKSGPPPLTLLLAFMCVTGNYGSLLCWLV